MKSMLVLCASIAIGLLISTSAFGQNVLFKHPRSGGFKVIKNDVYDFSNAQHFTGSGVLAVGFHKILQKKSVSNAKFKAGVLASIVGALKELEDGYRGGFGLKDLAFNHLGIIGFLYSSDFWQYTLSLKQVIVNDQSYGAGLRFFKTADFLPVNSSFGLYWVRDTRKIDWLGVDFSLAARRGVGVQFGVSFVQAQNANKFYFRPNVGLAVELF